MLEKFNRMTLLQDFYGRLLTPRQQRFFELYYDQNLSLGEIAEEYQISRQAVYDLLRRTEKSLEDYESRLGLVAKFEQDREKLQEALSWLRTLPRDQETEPAIRRVNRILYDIIGLEEEGESTPPTAEGNITATND
ncbi:MAG: YlxM family DNA-binding protein [Firmicutes bacterium]|nr:YlxM family DNA-binding protein [Bacillota bacterium]